MNILFIVATENECKEVRKVFGKDAHILVTGVGVSNVIHALSNEISLHNLITATWISDNQCLCDYGYDLFINVGYAGSNTLKVGEVVRISRSYALEPPKKVKVDLPYQPEYLPIGSFMDVYPCYTSYDFVTSYSGDDKPVVFDMELNYLCAFGLSPLYSYKIISDNLSVNEYEEFDAEKSWQKLKDMIVEDFYED